MCCLAVLDTTYCIALLDGAPLARSNKILQNLLLGNIRTEILCGLTFGESTIFFVKWGFILLSHQPWHCSNDHGFTHRALTLKKKCYNGYYCSMRPLMKSALLFCGQMFAFELRGLLLWRSGFSVVPQLLSLFLAEVRSSPAQTNAPFCAKKCKNHFTCFVFTVSRHHHHHHIK